jgi:hypothetical protein
MALRIDWVGEKFAVGHALAGHGVLNVKLKKLVRASVTVGRWPFDIHDYGAYSSHEIRFRAAVIRAYFTQSPSDRLVHSPLFATLDPTEQAIASYFVGSALAKIVSQEFLRAPWLMHVSRYWEAFGLAAPLGGRLRPDYVAPRLDRSWVVVEAKARRRITANLMHHASLQKGTVTINGAPPAIAVASIARLVTPGASLVLIDPDQLDDHPNDYELDFARWQAAYYRPLLQLLREADASRSTVDDRHVRLAPLEGLDLRIGLAEETWEQASSISAPDLSDADFERVPVAPVAATEHIGSDGVAVELGGSWPEERD